MAEQSHRVIEESQAAFEEAQKLMPGGVSSPVRAFKAVGGTPLFIKEAEGAKIVDVDGNEYIDYVASYGPMIAGHANERVIAALSKAIGRGTSFGAPTRAEVRLAEMIVSALPSIDMVRFVNSGTEAAMSAIRLARAATKRDLIVKCIGCYHGHADGLLAEAGSGALTLGTPSSPGIPESITSATVLVPYNDLDAAKACFKKYGDRLASFIVEPIAGNMGLVPPLAGYLTGLRELCDKHGTLLMFDEVMTGFRVAWGGAQTLYGIDPDITCLGKVIGGGLPVGAYAGKRKLMEMISPSGPVYQAGTLSGNPLAMAGGLATLEILKEPGAYETLEQRSARLAEGLTKAADDAGVPVAVNRVGSMIGLFFTKQKSQRVFNYADATASDTQAYARFFHAMLDNGVYLAPSQYETLFVGLAHTDDIIDRTIAAAAASFARLARGLNGINSGHFPPSIRSAFGATLDVMPNDGIDRSLPFMHFNDRGKKPRTRGLTEIRGPYYTPLGTRQLADILETCGAYVDSLKFGGGSFAIMPTNAVREIIDLCHQHNVTVSTGGFIERVLAQGGDAVDRYVATCKALGFDTIELSSGFISTTTDAMLSLMEKVHAAGLKAKPEIGIQFGAGGASTAAELEAEGTRDPGWAIAQAKRFLDAGASIIMIESEGITESVTTWRSDVPAKFVDALGPEHLMFEAADPKVFEWYVKNFGPDVNLFVDHSQIVELECLRSGIWGTKSTWGRIINPS